MDGDLYIKILEEDLQASINYYDKSPSDIIFQQAMTPSIPARRPKDWFQDNGSRSFHG